MKKILLTAGPIPARLDSVKFLTNRFKGGLALKTAEKLKDFGHDVHIICSLFSDIKTNLPVIYIQDVVDYYEKVLNFEADAYILAAAVANLMPSSPFKGKFPSHKYEAGKTFNIQFEIAPRVIDQIKQKYPLSTLIAYKLLDGSDNELIEAARKTLFTSKANIVFANHPDYAKETKLVVTNDGSVFKTSFDEHIELIDRLLQQQFYKTEVTFQVLPDLTTEDLYIIENYPKYPIDNFIFGSFAIRKRTGVLTTLRGKNSSNMSNYCFVGNVDHDSRIITANQKATLNISLFHRIFELNPHINFMIHGHKLIGSFEKDQYEFPGTTGDLNNAIQTEDRSFVIQLKYHGYIACFSEFNCCKNFIEVNK